MKIVIACDSFKGCLGSAEVAAAVGRGIRAVLPGAEVREVAIADGGEGTTEALVHARRGEWVSVAAHDPLGRGITARYGLLPGESDATAVVETAAASGLPLLAEGERDPRRASTFGTGELIADALGRGCRRFIIGLGGSATNDGGTGMLRALDVRFLEADGAELPQGGAALARLARIDFGGIDPRLAGSEFWVACDVTNPLCGPTGASHVYGPQKGATPEMARELDAALGHYGRVLEETTRVAVANLPGAGAAGGLGAAWLGGVAPFARRVELTGGAALVLREVRLREALQNAALLITGEGRMDAQSAFGKAAYGVLEVGKSAGVPVVAIVGALEADRAQLRADGFQAAHALRDEVATTGESMRRTPELLELVAAKAVNTFLTTP